MEKKEKEELDLFEILRAAYRFFLGLLSCIKTCAMWICRFIFQNKTAMIVFLLLGVVFGIYWSRPSNRAFVAESEMKINVGDAFYINRLLSSLNSYCLNEDFRSLSRTLELPIEQAVKIGAVKSYFYIDDLNDGSPDRIDYSESLDADTSYTKMQDRLLLQIVTVDSSLISTIQDALIKHIENNEYIDNMNAIRMGQLEERILSFENEIFLLDSLRRLEYFKDNKSRIAFDGTLMLAEKDKRLYHSDILALEKEKETLEWIRDVKYKSVKMASDLSVVKVTNKPFSTIVKFSLIVFVIGLFVTILFVNRKNIVNYLSR